MKTKLVPRQSNHHPYQLPAELYGTQEKRLYMNVSRWALEQNRPVNWLCVAGSFGISVRQATNIISIIRRRYSGVVESTVTKKKVGGITRTWLKVIAITPTVIKKCKAPPKTAPDTNELHHWKNIFLSQRRVNEGSGKHPAVSCENNVVKPWQQIKIKNST